MNIFKFTGAIALSIALIGCFPPEPPKTFVSDALVEKDIDHTWEVTDQASWNAVVSEINNAGENKKHLVTVKGSFDIKSPYPTSRYTAFNITTKNIVVVLEGDATISFSSVGAMFNVDEEKVIIVKDLKLKGNNNNKYSLVNISDGGKFIMEGNASVQGNTARGESGPFGGCKGFILRRGGGVSLHYGVFIMRDNASVTGNTAVGDCEGKQKGEGGGVSVSGGTFIMQDDASVTGNIASANGGGVDANGSFTMQGNAIVSGNAAGTGGGVYGRVTIQDNAKVYGNTAREGSDIHTWQNR